MKIPVSPPTGMKKAQQTPYKIVAGSKNPKWPLKPEQLPFTDAKKVSESIITLFCYSDTAASNNSLKVKCFEPVAPNILSFLFGIGDKNIR